MTDLAVLVPSRGRPQNVARLIEACEKTCRTDVLLAFGFDSDDPVLSANLAAAEYQTGHDIITWTGNRLGLAKWTNDLASEYMDVPYLASVGDDMVPITDGWDEQLIAVLDRGGPGFAYPEDRRRSDIPEACVISTPIVRALGWMCQPSLSHWYVDNVWADLGNATGCLHYCPDVIVEHRHPNVTGLPGDRTYSDAAAGFNADAAAYRRWRLYQMAADIDTVRRVREECSSLPS